MNQTVADELQAMPFCVVWSVTLGDAASPLAIHHQALMLVTTSKKDFLWKGPVLLQAQQGKDADK